MPTLFDPYTLAGLPLRNRVVLADGSLPEAPGRIALQRS